MTKPPPCQYVGITVKAVFDALRHLLARPDELAVANACLLTDKLLRSPTTATVPPLPAVWQLQLAAGDKLFIQASDGSRLDPAQFYPAPCLDACGGG